MVIVELFDRTYIENMISTFANRPERVVLVGDWKKMKRQDRNYRRFLTATGNDVTELEYRGVKVHQLHEIVRVIEGVVQDYPGCCFDLTGGDDLTMVAIGVVYERHRGQGLEMHQYNIRMSPHIVPQQGAATRQRPFLFRFCPEFQLSPSTLLVLPLLHQFFPVLIAQPLSQLLRGDNAPSRLIAQVNRCLPPCLV